MLETTDKLQLIKRYSLLRYKYDKLGVNLIQALELFLKENDINFLSISYRIKDENSFIEKVERKAYKSPFDQTEDFCGIRIICYYQNDVNKIVSVLASELDILENQDKEELLNEDQFGYRSTHLIVKIKKAWLKAPNYRGLENIKAEIQIRTVLMHAWAEIEHKLAYKKDTHIPKQFKRKLHLISAKLEEADMQFEEVKNSVIQYKKDLLSDDLHTYKDVELNLDSLQAFLDDKFTDRIKNINNTRGLVDEMIKHKISLFELAKSFEDVKSFLPAIEKETFSEKGIKDYKWAQVGVVRQILDLTNERYCESRGVPDDVKKRDKKWRKIIQESKFN